MSLSHYQIILNRIALGTMVLFVLGAFQANFLNAQSQSRTQSRQPAAQANQSPTQATEGAKVKKPYVLTSRIHLQKNSNRGYLVVRVEMAKGNHIYSLTQKGDLRPSKLTVTKSNQFGLLGQFAPDRPAEIIKNDPTFKQQVEKHKGVVQFFAPIEIAPGLSPDKLAPEVTFDGQVCSSENFCMPIMGEKVKGKFAGYFERTAKALTPKTQAGAPIRKAGSSQYR